LTLPSACISGYRRDGWHKSETLAKSEIIHHIYIRKDSDNVRANF
jgi:hypothetical protein